MSQWISVEDELPPADTYVLVHYNGGNYRDSNHQFGCECKVMKFVKGLSLEQRNKLHKFHPDKHTYRFCDEGFNNLKSYGWNEFGQCTYFGQDVDYWQHLTEIK